jgi:uncharacterized protein (TIGR02147 family)
MGIGVSSTRLHFVTNKVARRVHADLTIFMLIGNYFDYREFLRHELERRVQTNTRYSLRAFARDLSVAPQVLSGVISGKKNISPEVAVEIAKRLKLDNEELSYFHDLVELSQAKSDSLKEVIQYRLTKYNGNQTYRVLQEDVFKILADWYHGAILELTFTSEFQNDPVWIAKRLGITPLEARQAIERLLRLELLEEIGGLLRKTEVNITSTQDIPSAALKQVALQLIDKASDAIAAQSVDERDIGTMTMAIDPKRLPQAKRMIRKFRRELTEYLEAGSRSEVYCFASQLFSLTTAKEKGKQS